MHKHSGNESDAEKVLFAFYRSGRAKHTALLARDNTDRDQ